jgi:hypothetical protein
MDAPSVMSCMGSAFPIRLVVTSIDIESPHGDEAEPDTATNSSEGRIGGGLSGGFNLDDLLLCHAWTMPSHAKQRRNRCSEIDRPNETRSREYHETNSSDNFHLWFLQATRFEPYGSRGDN